VSWETLQIIFVLALIVVVFFGFVREVIAPDILAMTAVAALLIFQILGTDEVLKVFSNSAPITVACMLVISAALERTGVIETFGQFVSRVKWSSPWTAMAAMAVIVAFVSAFMNNTPLVVILTPVMISLAHSLNVAASRFLIPLSYASIFGGTCTLIGTSTNVIVDGVAQSHGLAAFGMFEITGVGTIMALLSIAYLFLIGRFLLPDRQTLAELLPDPSRRKFLAEVLVPRDSPLVGKTLTEAGLSWKRGFHVIDVIRDEVSFNPEHGEPALQPGDRLVIRTNVGDVMGLRNGGGVIFDTATVNALALEPITSHKAVLMEGIIGPNSRFVGQRVADLNLRRLYGAYIIAIHRQNESLHGNFDQVRLAFGDTILLEGPPEGLKRLFDTHELVNLSEPQARPFRRDKAPLAILVMMVIMALSAFEILPIAGLALIGAVAVVLLGCLDGEEAYASIEWRMLMLIFGMLALGRAMETTSAADLIVHSIVGLIAHLGPIAVLSIIYLLTSLLTEFMSNNAAAILLTPIAIGLAEQMGVDPRPFVVAVMFAASASFATPIGYQTNTFVYTAGGYKFTDFVKIGVPLNLLNWASGTLLIPYFFSF
jgi:di/tricarboxylate transporter